MNLQAYRHRMHTVDRRGRGSAQKSSGADIASTSRHRGVNHFFRLNYTPGASLYVYTCVHGRAFHFCSTGFRYWAVDRSIRHLHSFLPRPALSAFQIR
jgi:hypothetical protein